MRRTHGFILSAGLFLAGLTLLILAARPVETVSVDPIPTQQPKPVVLWLGDESTAITTLEPLPGNILARQGLRLYPGDRLIVDGAEAAPDAALSPDQPHQVQLLQAKPITLEDDGVERTVYSSAATLGEALWEAGIRLAPNDRLDPPAQTALDGLTSASLRRARRITLTAQDRKVDLYSAAETVGEALAEAGQSPQGLDYTIPAEAARIPTDGKIRLVHVDETVVTGMETIPNDVEYQLDPDTELDTERVIDPGQVGMIMNRQRLRYEDGHETARIEEGEWTASEPQTRLIGQGMKVVVRTIEGTDIEYWRKLTVYATSYSPCRVGGGRCSYHTAVGLPVQRGVAAVTLNWFRAMRGQQIYVPGYGTAVFGDTGGGIPGRYWIDLAFTDEDYESWHQWVTIYFLTPVPEYIPYILYP
jgi:uncharacterized protein YabE (DUF348 family)